MNSLETPETLRRAALAALFLLASLLAVSAQANHGINHTEGMTLAGAPLAIHGYDPVAFFTDGEARLGDARYSVAHDGGAYRFVSKANQRKFEKDPSRYLPQYGGFCAYGAALGAKFDGDPRVFAVRDGKLYFNLNPEIQKTWEEDVDEHVRKADANWPKIRDVAPASLK